MRADYRFLRAHGASRFRAARIAIARAVLDRWREEEMRKDPQRLKTDLYEEDRVSLTNTRDNFVRHAINTGMCPICKRPLDIRLGDFKMRCEKCEFSVSQAELDRHRGSR